ncbi:hypothetical protein GEMMAAP_19245 [Gemmatimonas phototrophica]|uniref:Uncharacterized protein n=1 Tax=Gemmatimonas phototrophica TaxID=1379270 RepID=A0A143BPF7_9BACT|nr:hypothetical protein GEMMAAP_19245 [Gemmatimonas phototrophica]
MVARRWPRRAHHRPAARDRLPSVPPSWTWHSLPAPAPAPACARRIRHAATACAPIQWPAAHRHPGRAPARRPADASTRARPPRQ